MSKKAKRLGAASAMSAKTWHRNQTEVNTVLQTLRRTSDESEDEGTKAKKISLALQQGRAARQSKSVNVMSLVSAAAGAVFGSAASDLSGGGGAGGMALENMDEIEEMSKFRSVLAEDKEMAADLAEVEAAMDAGDNDAAVDVVNETEFEKAVSELRVEPKNDEERKEKFKLCSSLKRLLQHPPTTRRITHPITHLIFSLNRRGLCCHRREGPCGDDQFFRRQQSRV